MKSFKWLSFVAKNYASYLWFSQIDYRFALIEEWQYIEELWSASKTDAYATMQLDILIFLSSTFV